MEECAPQATIQSSPLKRANKGQDSVDKKSKTQTEKTSYDKDATGPIEIGYRATQLIFSNS